MALLGQAALRLQRIETSVPCVIEASKLINTATALCRAGLYDLAEASANEVARRQSSIETFDRDSEGWGLFTVFGQHDLQEIQRLDEEEVFGSDEEALEFVQQRAAKGIERYALSLQVHNLCKDRIASIRQARSHEELNPQALECTYGVASVTAYQGACALPSHRPAVVCVQR